MSRKLAELVIVPYLFNFLIGVQFYKGWPWWRKWIEGQCLIWLTLYLVYFTTFDLWLGWYKPEYWPTPVGLLGTLLLSASSISLAYSFKGLSSRFLMGLDLSYGIYIYHMLVINSMVALGLIGSIWFFWLAAAITLLLAMVSWLCVESPALKLKYVRLARVGGAAATVQAG